MDVLWQDIGMSVSSLSMEIIRVIPPHFALPKCSMDDLQKDVGMSVLDPSLEIVLVPEQVLMVKVSFQKMITSFEHNGSKVDARSYLAIW